MKMTMNTLATKKRVLVVLTAGLLAGAPAMADTVAVTTQAVVGHAPILTGSLEVAINDKDKDGLLDVGDILTADETTNFRFSDPDGDPDGGTTYEWTVGPDVHAGKTYTIQAGDEGRSITLRATAHTDPARTEPHDATSAVNGKFSFANHTGEASITVAAGYDLTGVSISGGATPTVSSLLTAVPACKTTCDTNKIKYVWSTSDSQNGTLTPITGETTSTYTPKAGDQKKFITVKAYIDGGYWPISPVPAAPPAGKKHAKVRN